MNKDILKYNESQSEGLRPICQLLMSEIDSRLPGASAKIYHASPVWFINDNPVVGYWLPKRGVQLLFWSGISFDTPGLKPIGKHKAAGVSYEFVDDIDVELIRKWLNESKQIQWDYKNIRQHNGQLVRLI